MPFRRIKPNSSRGRGWLLPTPACTAPSISPMTTSKACWCGPYLESQLMDSLNPESLPPVTVTPLPRPPRIWKFWGTALWGLFIFAAMFVGQLVVFGWFLVQQEGPLDRAAVVRVAGN